MKTVDVESIPADADELDVGQKLHRKPSNCLDHQADHPGLEMARSVPLKSPAIPDTATVFRGLNPRSPPAPEEGLLVFSASAVATPSLHSITAGVARISPMSPPLGRCFLE